MKSIEAGKKIPQTINVIIEIPQNSSPVKYEVDEETGLIAVDRVLGTAMFYPANYGFVPSTLSDDGDPVDVLVFASYPFIHGSLVQAKPVGVIVMEDEKGQDEKIIAVPLPKIDPAYAHVNNYTDLPQHLVQQAVHFFERYKDLEKGKWVKVKGLEGKETAERLIVEGVNRFKK